MSLDVKYLLVAIVEQTSIITTKIILTPLFATHPDSHSDQFFIFQIHAQACLAYQTPHSRLEDGLEFTQHRASLMLETSLLRFTSTHQHHASAWPKSLQRSSTEYVLATGILDEQLYERIPNSCK